ncbi:hypothetical protein [Sphingobium aquiterrae]|uniref:hypothetical protein n=1 Tax=Sphingobium aquiterrae TaxID=2038656 RepID=UPI003016A711
MNRRTPAPLALVFITNGISATMARGALAQDGYPLSRTVLVKQRKVDIDWAGDCAQVIEFTRKPSLTMLGQVNQIGFYRQLLHGIRRLLGQGTLRDIYLPNIDNLVNNHILQAKRKGRLPGDPRLSVIAEGLMNYQDITDKDRAGWRWAIKPTLARLMRLRYTKPDNHLSGAFEPEIARVFAYSATGLMAPPAKTAIIAFPQVTPSIAPDPGTALVVMTGIAQWMTAEAFDAFKYAFAKWVNEQQFARVLVKPHPHYPSGGVEALIERSAPLGDPRRLEDMAAEIPAQTVIGYCTTGLITLKLIRPDLDFIDWGSDYYCEHAYHGDRSVIAPLRSAGIRLVEMQAEAA